MAARGTTQFSLMPWVALDILVQGTWRSAVFLPLCITELIAWGKGNSFKKRTNPKLGPRWQTRTFRHCTCRFCPELRPRRCSLPPRSAAAPQTAVSPGGRGAPCRRQPLRNGSPAAPRAHPATPRLAHRRQEQAAPGQRAGRSPARPAAAQGGGRRPASGSPRRWRPPTRRAPETSRSW